MGYYGPWQGRIEPVERFDRRTAARHNLTLDEVAKIRCSLFGGGWYAYAALRADVKIDICVRTRRLAKLGGRSDDEAHSLACKRAAVTEGI